MNEHLAASVESLASTVGVLLAQCEQLAATVHSLADTVEQLRVRGGHGGTPAVLVDPPTAADLRRRIQALKELKESGVAALSALDLGYTLMELFRAGYPFREAYMNNVGTCSLIKAKQAGYASAELIVWAMEQPQHAQFPQHAQLKIFSATELRQAGVQCGRARYSGFTCDECKEGGYTVHEAREAGFPINAIMQAGYTAAEAKIAGFGCAELKYAGYPYAEVALVFSGGEMKCAGYNIEEAKNAGLSCGMARQAGYNAYEAKRAGYSFDEATQAGYVHTDLLRAGFRPA